MSFGDPNNPYGPPPQQPPPAGPGGPGYGYPQQPPPPPQGYGIPQAPPYQQQPYPAAAGQFQGGYPGGPAGPFAMPGITRAAQIFLAVLVLAHVIVTGVYAYTLSKWDQTMADAGITGDSETEKFADLGKGVVVFFLALAAVFAVLGLILLLQYAKGGNGVRVCSIVYGSFAIISGIFTLAIYGLGLVVLIVAILLIVFASKRATADWFRRPRF
ncbi:hypothetical protein OG562_26620 [Streptomyces sp. NBC_01275]|uniref:hypothetical protein n=1 Tax=Streptomyces sp. NBC_01275 TaxID=2903807 RepID=UPI002252DB8A|nr:hypothetical protein [Streptomyces sp. NBC_01275]MCX4764471.1 hypothetical protein [Streptomyces sp. NBC_01275]